MAREYRLISADSHINWSPTFWDDYIPAAFRDSAWVQRRAQVNEAALSNVRMSLAHMAGRPHEDYLDPDLDEPADPSAYEPHARLRAMDADGVDAEVLIAAPASLPTASDTSVAEQRAVAEAYNNFISEFCSVDPERLLGTATILFHNMDVALEEMRRAARLPGIRAFIFDAYPRIPYWDERYEAFWQVAEDCGLPVHLHIGAPRSDVFGVSELTTEQLSRAYTVAHQMFPRDEESNVGKKAASVAMAPIGLMEPMSILLFSGVLDRHPSVKFIFTEAGASWLIYFRQWCDQIFRKHRYWSGLSLSDCPSAFIDRQVINTFIEDTPAIELRHAVGVGNMMWSTDFPHADSTWPHSRDYVERAFVGVPPEERHQIVAGNAISVYGLR